MNSRLPLKVDRLHFSYTDDEVLCGITGEFYEGTFYSIVGPNGSGKTTFLKLLAGINTDYTGEIKLFGDDMITLTNKGIACRLSFVPQMFNIQYAFTVEEVIAMGRYPYRNRFSAMTKEDRRAIETAIEETNLGSLRHRYVDALSGGELQRVIIARAIAQDTDIILLDEPISHLDIHYQHEIVVLLKRLCRERNKTVVAVLHDLNVTMNHCDHIFLLKDGVIAIQGEPKKVLTPEAIKKVYGLQVRVVEQEGEKWVCW